VDWTGEEAALFDAELMKPLGHAEQDKVFFNHLDAELEKINRFYKTKETEFVAQAIRLEKQLLALFEVRQALARQNLKMQTFSFTNPPELDRDVSSDTGELAYPIGRRQNLQLKSLP